MSVNDSWPPSGRIAISCGELERPDEAAVDRGDLFPPPLPSTHDCLLLFSLAEAVDWVGVWNIIIMASILNSCFLCKHKTSVVFLVFGRKKTMNAV